MKIIALTGPKHSGKTSVGRLLAALCAADFVDLDARIEARSGLSPRQLYERGPEVFREAEAQALAALIAETAPSPGRMILATGGGIIDNPAAMEALRAAARLVCLDTDAATAWRRIQRSAAGEGSLPPFLRGDDPKSAHRELHERRMAAYRHLADTCVSTAGQEPAAIAADLARVLCPPR